MLSRLGIVCVLMAATALPVSAGNGHMLHGFGPVNSAMAGAGAGLPMEPVGALMFNPALLAATEGHQITFATEFFEDGIEIELTLNEQGEALPCRVAGTCGTVGTTRPSNQIGVLPSFGWSMHQPKSKWAYGFGLIAIAGFRTDYPEDPSSIVFDTPPGGFGRIYTDYRVTKIPLALAYRVTPKLAVGGSLNAYLGELAIAPLPHRVFDEEPVGDFTNRFYPQGGNLDNEISFSVQLGFFYEASPKLSIGGSITTEQDFDPYAWNSTFANPDRDDFGQAREIDFDLDGPNIATLGAGYVPNDKIRLAFDVMWIEYDGVSGFGSPGGIVDRIVFPFGWRDVWVYKAGIEYQANRRWTLRAGYNYSNSPLRDEVVLTATGAPATFENHYCAGVGFALTDKVSAQASFYIVPRNHVVGPFPDLDNNVLGTMDTSNQLTSALVGLSWSF